MTSHGIDAYSRYQRVTSWPAVRKAGYTFAWFKVGEGTGTRSVAALSPAAAKRSGVSCGAYWYAQPGSAVQQANLLCNRAEALGLTALAPALDLEAPFSPNATAVNFAVAFCRQVAKRGHRPCLYANQSMMSVIGPAVRKAVPQTVVWVARYGASPTMAWHVWQHSDAGRVPGIAASAVDLNKGQIPYNVKMLTKEAAVVTTKDVTAIWGRRAPVNGADGKPRNPKVPKWRMDSTVATTLSWVYWLVDRTKKMPASVWSQRVPATNWDGSARDPHNPEWWASSVLATCLQNIYGLHVKVDAQTQQINQLTTTVSRLGGGDK